MNKIESVMSENRPKEWKKSETINGITSCIRVEEAKNGYVITKTRYGTPQDGGKEAKYIDEKEVSISKDNPLEPKKQTQKEQMKDNVDSMSSFMDSTAESGGYLNV